MKRSHLRRRLLAALFAALSLLLVLGACAPAKTENASAQRDDLKLAPTATIYQWAGVITESNLEGRHLELKRDCDSWVLQASSDDIGKRLQARQGQKVIVWGRVFDGVSIYMKQTISVTSVFGPNDPMPMTLVAIPEYPCPGDTKPVPPVPPSRGTIELTFSELAARGSLIWENGKPYLSTPSGRIALTIPANSGVSGSGSTQPGAATDAAQAPASLDVVAAGKWSAASALSLSARTLQPAPISVLLGTNCYRNTSHEPVQAGEAAVRGTLVRNTDRPYLKTEFGPVWLSFATRIAPAGAEPDMTIAPIDVVTDSVVLGKWSLANDGLHLAVRTWGSFLSCPPPPPPPPPLPNPNLLPGEISALGTLVWQSGRPYLDTPSGRIQLTIPTETRLPNASGAAEPVTPDAFPQALRLQVITTGKWSIVNGQLTLAVRSMQPYGPYPVPMPIPSTVSPSGYVTGKVTIGPLCPVEPCRGTPPNPYAGKVLVFIGRDSTKVPLQDDGWFKAALTPGTYEVTLSDCAYLGCRTTFPLKVTINAGQVTELNIQVDTGIR